MTFRGAEEVWNSMQGVQEVMLVQVRYSTGNNGDAYYNHSNILK